MRVGPYPLRNEHEAEAIIHFVSLVYDTARKGFTRERYAEWQSAVENAAVADALQYLQHSAEHKLLAMDPSFD